MAESEHDNKLPSLGRDEGQHEQHEKQQEASLPAKVEAAEAAASSFDARGISLEEAAKELPTFREELLGPGVGPFFLFLGWGSRIIPLKPKRVPFLFLGSSRV